MHSELIGQQDRYYLICATVATQHGIQPVNLISNTHPAKLILDAQKTRTMFVVTFFAEMDAELGRETNEQLKQINDERSPILVAR